MKPLNRPMFRMGGPIKEGIMDGIEEPRIGFQDGTPPSFFGLRFKEPINFANLFKSPATVEKEKQKLASIFAPDYSMSQYGQFPKLVNPTDQLTASTQNVTMPEKKYEMVDQDVISINDIDETAGDQDEAFNTSTGDPTYISKMQEGMLKRGTPGGDADVMIPPKKPITPAKDMDEKRLREILGYDRAVKRGNYSLIEAIRKGLTEGGVQGALNAAFAAGDTAYKDAEKLRQVADLKQYERELELKDYDKKRADALEDKITLLKEKQKLDPEKQAKGIVEKTRNFLIEIGVDETEALKIATKQEPTINAQVLKVQKSSGLPAITADVLDVSGGVYYGNEYKGRTSSTVDESTLADGWYLVDGSYFIEVDKGKFDLEGRSVTFPVKG